MSSKKVTLSLSDKVAILDRLKNGEKKDKILIGKKDCFTHFAANHQRRHLDQTRCGIYVTLTKEKKNRSISRH